jgi:hypothetical protein
MEAELVGWVDVAVDIFEITALVAVFWQLVHVRRDITAMLRVLRRIDRKMTAK